MHGGRDFLLLPLDKGFHSISEDCEFLHRVWVFIAIARWSRRIKNKQPNGMYSDKLAACLEGFFITESIQPHTQDCRLVFKRIRIIFSLQEEKKIETLSNNITIAVSGRGLSQRQVISSVAVNNNIWTDATASIKFLWHWLRLKKRKFLTHTTRAILAWSHV